MTKSLEEQIAEYKQEFTDAHNDWVLLWDEYNKLPVDPKRPDMRIKMGKDGRGMPSASYVWKPSDKPRINWDEDWDGKLIAAVIALDRAGFTVTRFLRKRKIFFKQPKELTRMDVMQVIIGVLGDDWRGISFKPCSIWWGANSTYRRY